MIISIKLKINNLIHLNANIFCNSVQECHKMFCRHLINIFFWLFFKWLQALTKELIDAVCRNNRFQMIFLIIFKFGIWISIQVDAKWWNIHQCLLRIPQRTFNASIWILENNFTSKAKISVEPCSPKTSSIFLYVHLLITNLVVNFCVRSCLEYWRISMAPNNLEKIYTSVSAFISYWESDDCRTISCEVIWFTCF